MGTSRSYASSERAFLESLELPPDSFEGELPRTAAQADVEVSRGTETLETTGTANRARAASVQDKGVRNRQLARVRLQLICSGSTPAVGVSLHVSVTSQQSTASPTPLPRDKTTALPPSPPAAASSQPPPRKAQQPPQAQSTPRSSPPKPSPPPKRPPPPKPTQSAPRELSRQPAPRITSSAQSSEASPKAVREPRQLDAAMAQKLSAGSVLPAAKRSDGSRNEKSKVLAAASPRAVDGRKACSSPPLLKVAPQSVETADHPGHGARPGGLRREIHGRLAGGSLQIHEIMIGDKDYPPYRLSLSRVPWVRCRFVGPCHGAAAVVGP